MTVRRFQQHLYYVIRILVSPYDLFTDGLQFGSQVQTTVLINMLPIWLFFLALQSNSSIRALTSPSSLINLQTIGFKGEKENTFLMGLLLMICLVSAWL